MTSISYLLGVLCLVGASQAAGHHGHHTTTTPRPRTPEENMHYKMDELEKLLESVSRQLMLQQLFFNERTRNSFNSGVKQIRYTKVGPRPYDSESHSGPAVASIHDHPDRYRTVGLGELDAVLNGIDFRTRHNDYKLRMPADNRQFNAMQDIKFPEVPSAVSHLTDVHKQVAEMREWFTAWNNQNSTHRPYKDYFKPVMCYLEGYFMKEGDKLVEPSEVDTHHLDALTHEEMEQKIRFSGYSGFQSPTEDFAYFPRYIMNVNKQELHLARWTYRINCHPIQDDVPLKYFHLMDDLNARMANNQSLEEYRSSPAARFHLTRYPFEKTEMYGLLDKIMQEIPGKENYGVYLEDDIFGYTVYEMKYSNYTALNTANYHRWYKVSDKGAMGVFNIHRGFADGNLFVSRTTQPNVASMTLHECHNNRTVHHKVCTDSERKYSFAFPLEIIYLTPLHTWNPYHIQYKGDAHSTYGKSVTDNNRHGGMTQATAYDGSNSMHWYHIPKELFKVDPTDKTHRVAGVLDSHGQPRQVMAAGIRTLLPEMGSLGRLRTRFPIVPVHGEGRGDWKELDALKEMAMNIERYSGMYEHGPLEEVAHLNEKAKPSVVFLLGKSDAAHGHHSHTLILNFNQMENVGAGYPTTVTSSVNHGHSHNITVYFHPGTSAFEIKACDGQPGRCKDGHPVHLSIVQQ